MRFAFNWARHKVLSNWNQRKAEASYGIPEEDRTPWIDKSAYSLRKTWNAEKHDVAPWWRENSKEAYACGLARAADAFANHSASKRGKRSGPKIGVPQPKKKHSHQSYAVTTGCYGLGEGSHEVKIPRVGTVRTAESTRKLARRLRNGTAELGSATYSYRGGRWYVSFSVRVRREGRGPHQRTGTPPSNRWQKANDKADRLERRVTAMRADGLHKLTTHLTRMYGTVVIEDLNVAGMLRNRSLAQAIWSTAFGQLRRQVRYKTNWRGGVLVIADRWYPSAKTCSACKTVKNKLMLGERVFRCDACGLLLDRDLNAARNLAALASSASCVGTLNSPAGNHIRPGLPGDGIATGRPETTVAGQP